MGNLPLTLYPPSFIEGSCCTTQCYGFEVDKHCLVHSYIMHMCMLLISKYEQSPGHLDFDECSVIGHHACCQNVA